MKSKKIIFLNIITIFFSLSAIAQIGNLDSTFAINGIYLKDLNGKWLSDIIVQPDNKIIGAIVSEFMLLRLKEDGSPDTTFGQNGVTDPILPQCANEIYQIALQADNKIVAVGKSNVWGVLYQDDRSAISRFNPDGYPDSTFGNGGLIINDIVVDDHDLYSSVTIQPNGKIIAGGSALSDLVIYRYNQDGTLDNSFGINGKVTVDMIGAQDYVSLALQFDGKIIASTITRRYNYKAAIILCFNTNGSLDSTFAEQGIATTEIGAGDDRSNNYILLQQDGKIVFGGFASPSQGYGGIMIRYDSDGSIDSTFGQNGKLFFDNYYEITSLALQSDGKILASIDYYGFRFCRLNPNGSFDDEFGDNGWVYMQHDSSYNYDLVNSIAIQHGGKILVGGAAGVAEPHWYNSLCIITRYNSGIDCPLPLAQFSYNISDNLVHFYDQSSSATDWYWDFGDSTFSSEQNPAHTYGENGKYLACLNITDTCGASQFCDTIIILPALINEPEFINFRIYPNPFSAFIKLELNSKESTELKIEILNIYGVKILEKQIYNKLNLIDTKNLPPGVYELRIRSSGKINSEKLLKINY